MESLSFSTLFSFTIVEGTFLDFYLHFRVACFYFFQIHESTDKTMALCATDDVALGPNRNLQSRIRYFSLDNVRVLQRSHDDITIHKIPTGAINRLNHVEKNQKDSKGLTFGDKKYH